MNTQAPTMEFHVPALAMKGMRTQGIGMCILDVFEEAKCRREVEPGEGTDKAPKAKWADDILRGVSLRVLKKAKVMMLPNPATVPAGSVDDPLVEYHTDSNGDLVDANEKLVSLPGGTTRWYFWTRNAALYAKVKAAYAKALDSARGKGSAPDPQALEAFAAAHGFDELELRPDHLDYYTGQNVFEHEVCPMGAGGSTIPHARMSALLYSVRAGDKQGLLSKDQLLRTDWENEKGGPDKIRIPPAAKAKVYIMARRPAISAMFLAEVVAAMMVNHVKNSTWHYSVFAEVEAIVAATASSGTDGGSMDAAMAGAGIGVQADKRFAELYRRYAHDCALARHIDTGKWLPEDLFEKAVDQRVNYGEPEGAAKEILDNYAIEHPIGQVADVGDDASHHRTSEANGVYDRPAHPAMKDDGSYDVAKRTLGGDAPMKYFAFYRLGAIHEYWPSAWGKEHGRVWRDVVRECQDKTKVDVDRLRRRIGSILAKYAVWPALVRDLAAHAWFDDDAPSEKDEQAKRANLHERFFQAALDFRVKWWDALPATDALAKPFYEKLGPFLDVVFSGEKAAKGEILDELFEAHAHELTAWLVQDAKAEARAEFEKLSSRMTPLAKALGATLESVEKISVKADLKNQALVIAYGGRTETVPSRFFEEETVKPGKAVLTKVFSTAKIISEQSAEAPERIEKNVERGKKAGTWVWVHARKLLKRKVAAEAEPIEMVLLEKDDCLMAHRRWRQVQKVAPWLKVAAAFFEIAEDVAALGGEMKEKGAIKTFVPLTGHVLGAVHETWEAVEFVYKHSEELLKRLEEVERAAKGGLYLFKTVAAVAKVGAGFAEGLVMMWEGSEMLEESENQSQRGAEVVATVYHVKGLVMIAGGAATTGAVVGGVAAGVGLAAIASTVTGIGLVVGGVVLVCKGVIFLKSDHSFSATLEGNLRQALSQELGKSFDHEAEENYELSHTHERLEALGEDVQKALAILARRHPADGQPLLFGTVFVNEAQPQAP